MSRNIDMFKEWEGVEQLFTIDEEIYKAFQKLSGDLNPLHVNEVFAKRKGFKNRVMYGNILNAFVSYGVGMTLPTKDVMIQTQEIQYKKPVYLGDTLKMNMKTDTIHESVDVAIIAFKFVNQDNVTVAKGKVQIGVFEQ